MIAAYVKKTICSKPGALSRRLRNPVPFHSPARAARLDLARQKGMGDVLLCTPALRELKRKNPNCFIRFYTDFVPLLRGLPYLDEVLSLELAPPTVRHLGYEGCTPPRGHLARIIGDQLGVAIGDVRPDCVVDPVAASAYRKLLAGFPKPHVAILRRASDWTPNKDWPHENWDVVMEKISRIGTAIEIGSGHRSGRAPVGSYLDWRNETSLEQLAAFISVADLYIGPVSGPMHIAAATATPAVVIYGGYESPLGYHGYEGAVGRLTQIALHSELPCAPCWKTHACPHDRKCLTLIEPDQVWEAARRLLHL